jgi:hypothetical protein
MSLEGPWTGSTNNVRFKKGKELESLVGQWKPGIEVSITNPYRLSITVISKDNSDD